MVERRDITDEEREALHRFLRLEILLEELLPALHGMVEIEFLPTQRRSTSLFNLVEPPLQVVKAHIENALEKRRSGKISERDIVRWSTFILLDDAYVWEGPDEDEIGDALNDLSFGNFDLYQTNR